MATIFQHCRFLSCVCLSARAGNRCRAISARRPNTHAGCWQPLLMQSALGPWYLNEGPVAMPMLQLFQRREPCCSGAISALRQQPPLSPNQILLRTAFHAVCFAPALSAMTHSFLQVWTQSQFGMCGVLSSVPVAVNTAQGRGGVCKRLPKCHFSTFAAPVPQAREISSRLAGFCPAC